MSGAWPCSPATGYTGVQPEEERDAGRDRQRRACHEGVQIVACHIDSPRLDLKPHPTV